MSYLANIIKNHIRTKLQAESEIERANQILELAPQKLEEADTEIQKAVQAAEILGELEKVSQQLYNTYPDIDVTTLGLPEPQEKRLANVVEEDTLEDVVEEPAPTPAPMPEVLESQEEEVIVDETD